MVLVAVVLLILAAACIPLVVLFLSVIAVCTTASLVPCAEEPCCVLDAVVEESVAIIVDVADGKVVVVWTGYIVCDDRAVLVDVSLLVVRDACVAVDESTVARPSIRPRPGNREFMIIVHREKKKEVADENVVVVAGTCFLCLTEIEIFF